MLKTGHDDMMTLKCDMINDDGSFAADSWLNDLYLFCSDSLGPRTGLPVTLREKTCDIWILYLLTGWCQGDPSEVGTGRRAVPIWILAIFSCGDILSPRFTPPSPPILINWNKTSSMKSMRSLPRWSEGPCLMSGRGHSRSSPTTAATVRDKFCNLWSTHMRKTFDFLLLNLRKSSPSVNLSLYINLILLTLCSQSTVSDFTLMIFVYLIFNSTVKIH